MYAISINKMAALETSGLPLQSVQLHVPPLNELLPVLSRGLRENFESVTVEEAECPDLSERPFSLAAKGLGGKTCLLDVGGPPFLVPLARREKLYDIPGVCKLAEIEPTFVIGAGAAPWPYLGVNCEGMYNMSIVNNTINQQSRIASIYPKGAAQGEGTCKLEILPKEETRCAILANLFVSEGKPGKVLRIVCKKRIGKDDFITSIRNSLHSKYGDKCVGLGGMFLLKTGSVKQHIMPDFSKVPLESDEELNDWLHFFNMQAPLINVGTLVSVDPGLDLRVQHFHSFSNHGQGGHYHNDTTPDEVEYEGYFNTAERILRIDRPEVTHSIGRD